MDQQRLKRAYAAGILGTGLLIPLIYAFNAVDVTFGFFVLVMLSHAEPFIILTLMILFLLDKEHEERKYFIPRLAGVLTAHAVMFSIGLSFMLELVVGDHTGSVINFFTGPFLMFMLLPVGFIVGYLAGKVAIRFVPRYYL